MCCLCKGNTARKGFTSVAYGVSNDSNDELHDKNVVTAMTSV